MSKKEIANEMDNETAQSFNKVMDWLFDKCSKNQEITDNDKEVINRSMNFYEDVSIDIVNAKSARFLNLDILNSNFKIFDGLELWQIVYQSCLAQVQMN